MSKFRDFLLEHKNIQSNDMSINEAISYNDMTKALDLMLKYLRGKVGNLYQLPGFETIKKKEGMFVGIHYIDDNGKSMRFNWAQKGGDSNQIHSIDFFPPEMMFASPKLTLDMNGESLAKILPAVVEIFNKMSSNVNIEDYIKEERSIDIYEGRLPGSKGKKTLAKLAAAEQGQVLVSKSMNKAEKLLEQTPYADPDTIFDDMEAYVQMVMKGLQASLIICGGPGIGKCLSKDELIEIQGL